MRRLYTIGHSSHSEAEFFALLARHTILLLLDVRSAPYSRWVPHFNRESLQPACQAHQVDYRYAGTVLGGRPDDAALYKDETLPDESMSRAAYLKHVDYPAMMRQPTYIQGIARVIALVDETAVRGGAVALMCSEGEPLECHRHHLIARSLIDPAVRVTEEAIAVWHITRDGDAAPVDPDQFIEPPQQMSLF